MKKMILSLAVLAGLLGGCVVYDHDHDRRDYRHDGRGGPGNDFCPPGQEKRGNC